MICPRCDRQVIGSSMSWFNLEEICLECKADEPGCPNYVLARTAEQNSLNRGERQFPGIGLAQEDLDYLAARRQARTKGDV